MNRIDLTIIIPCSTDTKIKYCIQSIYETCTDDVEILVSLNGASEEIKEILKGFQGVKICEIKKANLSKAYNNGIKHASRSNILLMDSDCVFGKNTIKLLYSGLKHERLSKGLVVFKSTSLMSKIISKVREYTTTDFINSYSPPLAFSKDIKDLIGGYYFHEQIPWSEDSEFNYRVQQAGLKIHYNSEAVIYHTPLIIKQDIRSGFRYGRGKAISEKLKLLPRTNFLKPSLYTKRFVKTYEVLQKKGLFPALYYFFIWRSINRIGYLLQNLLFIFKKSFKIVDAVEIMLVTKDLRFLLQLRDKENNLEGPNNWGFIGGAINDEENYWDAIFREVKEEIGYELKNPVFFDTICDKNNNQMFVHHIFYEFIDECLENKEVYEGQRIKLFNYYEINKLELVPWFQRVYSKTFKKFIKIYKKKFF